MEDGQPPGGAGDLFKLMRLSEVRITKSSSGAERLLDRTVGSLGARGAKSPPCIKRRSGAAARQKNKDSRLAPLTLPPRRASRVLHLSGCEELSPQADGAG